jgi:hypothetical protein
MQMHDKPSEIFSSALSLMLSFARGFEGILEQALALKSRNAL